MLKISLVKGAGCGAPRRQRRAVQTGSKQVGSLRLPQTTGNAENAAKPDTTWAANSIENDP